MAHENRFCPCCGAAIEAGVTNCIVCQTPVAKSTERGDCGFSTPSPFTLRDPLRSLSGAMRAHLEARRIWETTEDGFALNDEVSRQVRRDTLRFRIDEKYWVGL